MSGDLFPVSPLFSAIARQEQEASDAAAPRAVLGVAVDVRAQWQSVDAWTALQQAWLDAPAGVDAHARQSNLGLHFALSSAPAAGLMHTEAQRVSEVATFKLTELA